MNTIIIILGVVLILVIVFMIFRDFFEGKNKLSGEKHLADGVTSIPGSDLSSPKSSNVTYSIWIYVQQWSSDGPGLIFSRDNDTHMILETNTAKLKVHIGGTQTDGVVSNALADIEVTNNFPIQKWVCVLVSVDNNITDVYLDGKLMKSIQLNNPNSGASTISPINESINFGQWTGCYISKFERIPRSTDPKTAYDKYREGNGSSGLGNALGNFNLKLAVTKDNVETSKFLLFG